jgi:ABC-2 type transport system ATP-binding protein
MSSSDVPSIEAVKLSKQFGSFTAVSELNLKIEGAKCVGFLGPNGAGKTTTLKMFTDLIKPTSGEALINGVNAHTNKKKALESVGTLIEMPEIYPSLTPRESLMMIAEIRGVPVGERKKRIEEAIAEVRMEEWTDKRVGKFSKGMKQRICIASALLSNPCVLLLDEPTAGLDPRGMNEVRNIIKSLKNKARLIFMSSHLLSEVSDVCDEVAMIDHGKLIVYDTLPNVIAKFSKDSNLVEVGLRRPIDGAVLKAIGAIQGVIEVTAKNSTLQIRFSDGLETQEKIFVAIANMNIGAISYKPSGAELEDVYLNLIKDTL